MMKKLILFLIMICILSGCIAMPKNETKQSESFQADTKSTISDDSNEDESMDISLEEPREKIDLSQISISLEQIEVEEHTYAIPIISGLDDEKIEAKVNETIKKEFFITEDNGTLKFGFYMLYAPDITNAHLVFLSQDFITINMVSINIGANVVTKSSYCTIDIKTGELVRLGDIVELSDTFVAFIEDGNYTYPMYQIRNFRHIADEANLNNIEYFEAKEKEGDHYIYIESKCAFYLEDGYLWIQHSLLPQSGSDIRIPIEYIHEFLIRKDADYKNFLGPSEPRDGDG